MSVALLPSCDYSYKTIKKEIDFFGFRFVYYRDGSGSLHSNLSKEPIYQTNDCSFKEKGLKKIKKDDLFIDIIKNIGFPRFLGEYECRNLDFGKPNDDIYRIAFNDDFSMKFDWARIPYWAPSAWCSDRKNCLPSIQDTEKLKIGMTLDEVVEAIGKPQLAKSGWPAAYYFDLAGGNTLITTWNTNRNHYEDKPYRLTSMEITKKDLNN